MDSKKIFIIASCIMLLLAVFGMPYGFYQVLRILVCGVCVWLVIDEYNKKGQINFIQTLLVILYNPLIKIHFDKSIWNVINIITIAYFVYVLSKKDD